jgi:ArsR family transcriptional regulator
MSTTVRLSQVQFERIAKALADPRRFALLETIAGSDHYPCSRLQDHCPVGKATISHHFKELIRAGLVESERDGQRVNYIVRRDVLAAYTATLQTRLNPALLAPAPEA